MYALTQVCGEWTIEVKVLPQHLPVKTKENNEHPQSRQLVNLVKIWNIYFMNIILQHFHYTDGSALLNVNLLYSLSSHGPASQQIVHSQRHSSSLFPPADAAAFSWLLGKDLLYLCFHHCHFQVPLLALLFQTYCNYLIAESKFIEINPSSSPLLSASCLSNY